MTEQVERFVRLDEVILRTGLKRSTIYKKIKEGSFPKSISITATSVAWLESEISEWIADKINQRQ